MFMLLQLLQPELDDASQGQDLPGAKRDGSAETITAVTRRILPALRHYSTWLVATAPVIVSQIGTASINVHIKELWESYCQTLTLLINAFPPQQLIDVDYLLEEDAATVGFKPFRDSKDCHIYTDDNGEVKKRSTDPGVERYHPNVEMAARIRGILQDGITLATAESKGKKAYPIYMVEDKFRFDDDGSLSLSLERINNQQSQSQSPVRPSLADSEYEHATPFAESQHTQQHSYQRPPSAPPSESQQSFSNSMNQMVDDLLTPSKTQQNANDSNETSYGMHSAASLDLFSNMQLQGTPDRNQSQAMQRRISGISGFPGLTSAFAPRPGELGGMTRSGSTPGAGLRLAALTSDEPAPPFDAQMASAPTQRHSFQTSPSRSAPWNDNRTPPHLNAPPPHMNPQPRPHFNVAQELQRSLAAEYQPPGLSGFSNTSSLYQNTPAYRQQTNVPQNLRSRGSKDALPNLPIWSDAQGYHR